MRKSIQRVFSGVAAMALAMSVTAAAVPTGAQAAKAKASFDPAATYHATIGFQQTGTWIFHDEYTSETLGKEGTDLDGCNYDTDVMQSGDDGTTKVDGTITGAEIKGNGTYTVKVEGLNNIMQSDDSETKVSMVYISTDIPADAEGTLQFSDVSWKVDGVTQSLPDNYFFKPETKDAGYLSLYVQDTYAKDQGEYPDSPTIGNPKDSIEITFTISGMSQDNPDAQVATSSAAGSASTAADASTNSGNHTMIWVSIIAGIVVIFGVLLAVVAVKNKD